MNTHIPHPRIEERAKIGPHLTKQEHIGINGRLAMLITNMVSTMWCAYLFAIIALISLPAAIEGGTATIVSWIAQTFLQLVLLSVIMVGQKVAARASDKQALQTFKDTEAVLEIQDEVHKLIKINNELTEEIHSLVTKKQRNIKSLKQRR
jgi:sensor histidine kinase YesM